MKSRFILSSSPSDPEVRTYTSCINVTVERRSSASRRHGDKEQVASGLIPSLDVALQNAALGESNISVRASTWLFCVLMCYALFVWNSWRRVPKMYNIYWYFSINFVIWLLFCLFYYSKLCSCLLLNITGIKLLFCVFIFVYVLLRVVCLNTWNWRDNHQFQL
jgi:hypothetical protein